MPVSTANTFWESTRGSVLNDSTASLDHNSVAFRYKGSVGNGGYLRTFAINYGGRESWCAIDFTRANESRKWWFRVDGSTYSTDKAAQNLSQQSIALHRRQVGKQTTAGLDVEQVEMLHTKYPFVLSLLRVTNNNATAKSVTSACSVTLLSGQTMTHRTATDSFWGSTPTSVTHGSTMYNGFGDPVDNYWTYTMTNTSGLLVKMVEEDTWDTSETSLNLASAREQSTGLSGIPMKTVTIQPGETYTFEVIYGVAGAQAWTEAELLEKADELIDYGVENYCNDERNRVNYWYDNVYDNINIGSTALKDYLPLAFQYVEEQVITQKSFNQYSLHGGWADEARAVRGANWEGEDELWYPYPTSTMHQSYPYHFIQLQTGMDATVKSELVNYANRQDNSTGSMGFHMWMDDVAYPYGSPYTEQMWVLGVYDYVAFTQDHAFLTQTYNTKTILERLRLAYNMSKSCIVNGLVGGADWHDGWGEIGDSYNSQGSMTHCMMLDAMVELDPTNASTYASEASTMRAQIVSVMEVTDSGHTFYKRRVGANAQAGNASWASTHVWNGAILDSSFWGVIAGVNTVAKQETMITDLVTGTSPRGYDFVYAGAEGLGVHNGNQASDAYAMGWLCYQAWCEKFFELAIADSMLGEHRMLDIFDAAPTAAQTMRYPEQIDGPALNSGEPTYSGTALVYKWLLTGIFGVKVALDGTVTSNPAGVPTEWTDPSVSLRVADKFYVVDGNGNITNQSVVYDVASAIDGVSTELKTVTAKARIKAASVTKTVQAKSRLKKLANDKTVTAKSRIKQVSVTKTETSKARIKILGNNKTVTSKARIKIAGVTKTVQAKARIKATATKTETSRARIKITGITKTVQARSRIKLNVTKTETSKARIKRTYDKTATSKARIAGTGITVAVSAKARIKTSATKTAQAKSRIRITNSKTVQSKAAILVVTLATKTAQAKARVKATQTKTVQAGAMILQIGVVTKQVQAKARIKKISLGNTVQAKARIKRKNITNTAGLSKARIKATATNTVTAKSRIRVPNRTVTVTSKARIEHVRTKTATAKARIAGSGLTVSVSAKARIKAQSTKTVSSRARLLIHSQVEISAKASIAEYIPPVGVYLYVWNGTEWSRDYVSIFDGNAWLQVTHVWDGIEWSKIL